MFKLILSLILSGGCVYATPIKTKLKVMVADTGFDSKNPILDKAIDGKYKTPEVVVDFSPNGHGTHVMGVIISKTCSDVEIIPCLAFEFSPNKLFVKSHTVECFRQALAMKVDIINYSGGGVDEDPIETAVIAELDKANTLLIVAAGNEGKPFDSQKYYPAALSLPNIIPVGNLKEPGLPAPTSNSGPHVAWEPGTNIESFFPGGARVLLSGTSQAAAMHTSKIIKLFCDFQKKQH